MNLDSAQSIGVFGVFAISNALTDLPFATVEIEGQNLYQRPVDKN
jgi:hypothetical protein